MLEIRSKIPQRNRFYQIVKFMDISLQNLVGERTYTLRAQ